MDDPAVRMVIDLSGLTGVYFDPERSAFAVEAGATLGEVYRRLYIGWGVTIPGGSCPGVGAGGHVAVVDGAGDVRAVVATREPSDPHRELWCAHTGGGGGNFGVVTRYWFRSLPRPPARVVSFTVTWPWQGMDEHGFHRLVGNFGAWCERHGAPGTAQASLYSELILTRRPAGAHMLVGQVPGDAVHLLDEHVAALGEGVGVMPSRTQETLPWLAATLGNETDDGKGWRLKVKSAFHRASLTERQLAAAYHHLTRTDYHAPAGSLSLSTYGGAINSVQHGATATAQRDSAMLLFYLTGWTDPAEYTRHLGWIREFYHDMYADTGDTPTAGAYINYPDIDLADSAWNPSDRPWHALYYGDNYPRLRAVKARWDPQDVFRHALSVRRA